MIPCVCYKEHNLFSVIVAHLHLQNGRIVDCTILIGGSVYILRVDWYSEILQGKSVLLDVIGIYVNALSATI
jgi:hypothetical protein